MFDIYISPFNDPYINLSIENHLLLTANTNSILYLWVNDPCVIIGRNQNIFKECNLRYLEENNIHPVRRFSGGGAVYQDKGNLNYTFITKSETDENYIKDIILNSFHSIGIDVIFSGRNDLLVRNRKFSGYATYYDNNHFLYHGTCMVDVNLNHLKNSLTPSEFKLKTHSIQSVSSRVINLKELYDIDIDIIKNSFLNNVEINDIKKIEINENIIDIYNKLKENNWIFNDCPKYSISINEKINNENYTFEIDIKNGIIKNIQIYSDSLKGINVELIEKKLINKNFSLDIIEETIKK